MANTYTQCYFHIVFSVKNRNALIRRKWKDELERYVTGIVQNHRHKMLAIGTMPDHVHIWSFHTFSFPNRHCGKIYIISGRAS